jgi:hypothetical protein
MGEADEAVRSKSAIYTNMNTEHKLKLCRKMNREGIEIMMIGKG